MHTNVWVRRAVLAIVWGLAVSTWASIGHHLMGLPDVGPLLVVGTVAFILVRPMGRTGSPAPTSNQADTAVHARFPTG